MSIARAGLLKVETAKPIGLITEVTAAAKKDLQPGDLLDGGGGSTVYAQVEKAEIARKENSLPFGFAEHVEVARPVKRDAVITYDDVRMKTDDFLFKLRQIQDATLGR